ncbi:MAG: protein kinase [Acidimicrobiia bacterium]|nr:protein kinase [Acidimicrobiia bacterium]
MPPPIAARYRLEVRLGRDGDVEEWLATDQPLDRPVLIRSLGPDTTPQRRREFVASVLETSKVNHPNIAVVYGVEEVTGGAYSVSEWTGGATLASRLEGGRPIDVATFHKEGPGLAEALATLHRIDVVHGSIDAGAVAYTEGRTAKLGAFGRIPVDQSPEEDVAALAETLTRALLGDPDPSPSPPSEAIDGLSPMVDRILASAFLGKMSAEQFAAALREAPRPRLPEPETPGWSRRLLMIAGGLVVLALVLIGMARLLAPEGTPLIPPAIQSPAAPAAVTVSTPNTTLPTADFPLVTRVASFDPFGDDEERDDEVSFASDGDPGTSWRTELYRDPLPRLKEGVGVVVSVTGTVGAIDISSPSESTHLSVLWSDTVEETPATWEHIAMGMIGPSGLKISVPARSGGHWLLWMTNLAEVEDGFTSEFREITFSSR